MLQSEFTERTGMNVSSDEFEVINEMYNYCDVDKDEFCKLWVKMNINRVNAYKEQKAKEAKRQKAINDLWNVYGKYFAKLEKAQNGGHWHDMYLSPAFSQIIGADERKIDAFCDIFHESYDKSVSLGTLLSIIQVWATSAKKVYCAA